jgi:voltage-dependent potassium channel beta subunit
VSQIVVIYRRLGNSGLQTSAIGLGAWATVGETLDLTATTRLMAEAFEAGVNFYDNAETYGDGAAERLVGRALRVLGWRRESFLLSSKVYWGTGGIGPTARGLNRKHVFEACDEALRRFGVDHLDLYLCHRPDPDTPIEETVRAMSDLISHHGKVLYWGTSEWPATAILAAHEFARANGLVAPTTEQAQYNLFARCRVEDEYAELYRGVGLGLTVWSPLACGLLAGRYGPVRVSDGRLARGGYEWLKAEILGDLESERLDAARQLGRIAAEHGATPAQLSMAWVLSNRNVASAITGASVPAQLRDSLRSLDLLQSGLIEELRETLDHVFPGGLRAEGG